MLTPLECLIVAFLLFYGAKLSEAWTSRGFEARMASRHEALESLLLFAVALLVAWWNRADGFWLGILATIYVVARAIHWLSDSLQWEASRRASEVVGGLSTLGLLLLPWLGGTFGFSL